MSSRDPVRVPSPWSGPLRRATGTRPRPYVPLRQLTYGRGRRHRPEPRPSTRCRAPPPGGHQRSTRLRSGASVECGNSRRRDSELPSIGCLLLGKHRPGGAISALGADRTPVRMTSAALRPAPPLIRQDRHARHPREMRSTGPIPGRGNGVPTSPRNSFTRRKTLVRATPEGTIPLRTAFRDQGHQSCTDRFGPGPFETRTVGLRAPPQSRRVVPAQPVTRRTADSTAAR